MSRKAILYGLLIFALLVGIVAGLRRIVPPYLLEGYDTVEINGNR